jgi:hypothetical protein
MISHPGRLLDAANRPLTSDIALIFWRYANPLSIGGFSGNFIAWG